MVLVCGPDAMEDRVDASNISAAIDEAKSALAARAASFAAEHPSDAATTAAGWTLNEMLAHVAFWEEAAPPVISYMLRGLPMPGSVEFGSGYVTHGEWPNFEIHNAREAAWGRSQTLESVLARWERAHAALLAVLETVTVEEARTHARYYADLAGHLSEHAAELD